MKTLKELKKKHDTFMNQHNDVHTFLCAAIPVAIGFATHWFFGLVAFSAAMWLIDNVDNNI